MTGLLTAGRRELAAAEAAIPNTASASATPITQRSLPIPTILMTTTNGQPSQQLREAATQSAAMIGERQAGLLSPSMR